MVAVGKRDARCDQHVRTGWKLQLHAIIPDECGELLPAGYTLSRLAAAGDVRIRRGSWDHGKPVRGAGWVPASRFFSAEEFEIIRIQYEKIVSFNKNRISWFKDRFHLD